MERERLSGYAVVAKHSAAPEIIRALKRQKLRNEEDGQAYADALSAAFGARPMTVEYLSGNRMTYLGVYHFPITTAVFALDGQDADCVAHEFAHHLQWTGLRSGYGGITRNSRGHWLWHDRAVFVPLLDRVAAVGTRVLERINIAEATR